MKVFLVVILLFSFNLYGANQCADLFNHSKNSVVLTNEEFNQLSIDIDNYFKSYDIPRIMTGELKPDWNHYNKLLKFIEKTEYIEVKQLKKMTQHLKFASQIISDSIKNKIETLKSSEENNKKYNRFLDYNFAYFKLLEILNKNLKSKTIPVPSLKELPTELKLKKEGEKIVKNLQSIVDKKFSEETGFQSKEDLKNKLIKFNPQLIDLIDLVENKLTVTMRRPERGRFWIPLAGFQNQRITESSNGSFFLDSTKDIISERDKAESHLTQIKVEDYVPLSGRLKPNYAEARPSFSAENINFQSEAYQYGSDLWIIKKSVLESRATWTPSDSLGPGRRQLSDLFIPWKERILMSLYAMVNYNDRYFAPDSIPQEFSTKFPFNWDSDRRYFEVQIFGPLGLEDVEAFHFTDNPPDKKLYDLLKSKGIKVFDSRKSQNKEYFGEESR